MIGPGRLVLQSFPRRLRILARWSLEEVRVHVCIHGVLRWPSVKVPDESKSIEGRALDRTSLGASFEGLTDEEMIEAVVSSHKPSTNPLIRMVWVVLGSLFVAFAGIGVILPGWPTTSWLVAAAYCFGRSSQRLFRWLLTNRMFGGFLQRYYRAGGALPFHSKIAICGLIGLVSTASIWYITRLGDPGFGQATIAVVAVAGIWWVGWRVPTTG